MAAARRELIIDALTRNVLGVWGDDGARWLADLPAIVREVARDWDLAVGAPYELSYHYVTAVTCADGTPAVLKLGVPAGSTVVCVLTGHGLKDPDIAIGQISVPTPVDADPAAIRAELGL